MIKITVLGVPGLQAKLNRLPDKLAKKVVRKAMRKAMKPVTSAAKAKAPVLTGATKAGLKVMARKFKSREKFGVKLQVMDPKLGDITYYAGFNELGTRHQPARPFLRPALKSNEGTVLSIMRREVASGIDEVVAKG